MKPIILRMNPNRPDAYRAVWWASADRKRACLVTGPMSSRLPSNVLLLRAERIARHAGILAEPGEAFVIGDAPMGTVPLES